MNLAFTKYSILGGIALEFNIKCIIVIVDFRKS